MENEEVNSIIIDTVIKTAIEKNVNDYLTDIEANLEPHQFSDNYHRKKNLIISKYKSINKMEKPNPYIKRIAMIIISGILVFAFTGVITVQAFRYRLFQFFEQIGADYFSIRPLETDKPFDENDLLPLQKQILAFLPGFTKTEELTTRISSLLVFKDDNGNFLDFKISNVDSDFSMHSNIEDIKKEEISINNCNVILIENLIEDEGVDCENYTFAWVIKENSYTLISNLDKKLLIDILEKLIMDL